MCVFVCVVFVILISIVDFNIFCMCTFLKRFFFITVYYIVTALITRTQHTTRQKKYIKQQLFDTVLTLIDFIFNNELY